MAAGGADTALSRGARELLLLRGDRLFTLGSEPREVGRLEVGFTVSGIAEDEDGTLWVGSLADGAWRPLDATLRVSDDRVVSDEVFVVRRAGPWSVAHGRLLHDGMPVEGVSAVRDIVLDGDTLWAATLDHGLLQVRERAIDVVLPPEGLGDRIERLWWDAAEDTLWARSGDKDWWSALPTGKRLSAPRIAPAGTFGPGSTLPFRVPGSGRAWAVFGRISLDDGTTEAVPGGRDYWHVFESWVSPGGSAWLGTDQGVFVGGQGPWRALLDEHGARLPRPRSFAALADGSTVIACDGGLAWVDALGQRVRGPRAPLPANVRLGIDSPARGGAVFWFTLPLGVEHLGLDDVEVEPQAGPLLTGELPEPSCGGGRVLLVEDNDELRAFLLTHLARRFQAEAVVTAEEALERLERGAVDLLVSDVMLPGMSGMDLARRARSGPARAVLLISARSEVADRVEGLAVADDYLAKPFQVRELLARCDALLRRLGPAAPAEGAPAVPEVDAGFLAALDAAADAGLADAGFGADELARAVAMSRRALHDRMHELGLDAPGSWLRERRMARADALIERGAVTTVAEVAWAVGLTRAYFTRAYTARAGVSPGSRLKDRGEG